MIIFKKKKMLIPTVTIQNVFLLMLFSCMQTMAYSEYTTHWKAWQVVYVVEKILVKVLCGIDM